MVFVENVWTVAFDAGRVELRAASFERTFGQRIYAVPHSRLS
jgi:hypothetical protein